MKAYIKDIIEIIRNWAIFLFVIFVLYTVFQDNLLMFMLVCIIIIVANPKYFKD